MTLSLTHTFVSTVPDGTDDTVVRPSNWNDTHTIAGTLPIANGGTNTTSVPANGQLLIGNGTGYTVANLTAGTGMTITNTAGGITLSAPENGTVTGVTASSPIASSGGTAPNISLTGTVDVAHGGTGQTSYTDGQLLIGNTTGNTLTAATLTAGTGVTITNGHGTITISAPDTGTVTSVTASSPLASSGGATPNLSLTGTVAIANGGTAGTATPTAGAVPYGTGTAYGFSAAGTTGQVLTSAGAGTPTWTTPTTGTVTSVTASSPIASSGGATPNLSLGTVPIANGGTNSTATPTAGAIVYGTGTAQAYTAAGTTGQVLTSATAGTPTWTTPTTGTVTNVAQTFTGGIISVAGSPITSSGTLALTVAGTSGGVPYFSSGSAWASTAAGTTGQYLKSNGASAPTWADASTVYTKTTFTATASQTTFTVNYTVGYVDVFLNGVKLTVTDYTASNGTSVVLAVAAALNDIVETLSWTVWSVTNTAIGAGTGTSLALNGATLGANALAVTGTAAFSGAITTTTQSVGDNSTKVATTAYVDRAVAAFPNYISKYQMSAAGGTSTFSIGAGSANDSTNTYSLVLASAFTKTTGAWTVGTGNGSLDTGAIANSSWYAVYVISQAAGVAPDILTSKIVTPGTIPVPTMPATYTLYRYIGSVRTDGSAHYYQFYQQGNQFIPQNQASEFNSTYPNATPTLLSLTGVPPIPGITGQFRMTESGGGIAYMFNPDSGTTSSGYGQLSCSDAGWTTGICSVSTLGKIYYTGDRGGLSGAIMSQGWWDQRGVF